MVMLAVTPFLNNNSLLNTAMAQGYDANYGDSYYSQYPTDVRNMNVEQVQPKDSLLVQ